MKSITKSFSRILTLNNVDHFLEFFCVLMLVPIYFSMKIKGDVYDILTYLSFVISVWAAVFGGRGVFSVQMGEDELFSKGCFLMSIFFLTSAILLLTPTMFRHDEQVLNGCLLANLGLFVVGGIVASIVRFFGDKRHWIMRVVLVPAMYAGGGYGMWSLLSAYK